MRTNFLSAAAHFGIAATLAALLAQPVVSASAKEARVTISNFTFEPQMTSVPLGSHVTFVNTDDMVHTIVAADGSFRSPPLETGQSFVATLGKAGTVTYFCGLHPFMKGSIVVK